MRPLEALRADDVEGLDGLLFDLDDTLLDRGALREEALGALYLLRRAGLRLAVCTGRPATWAELACAWLPIDVAVAENGAVAFASSRAAEEPRRGAEPPGAPVRVTRVGAPSDARRPELLALATSLAARTEGVVALADDNAGRVSDVTLDVGEHRRAPPDLVAALRRDAARAGARTSASSIHLHLTFSGEDKASGSVAALGRVFSLDPTRALRRWAFAGDSGNDAAAFAAFERTFGVANVREHLGALSRAPRWVAARPRARGFADIAAALAGCPSHPSGGPGGEGGIRTRG